MRVYNFANSRIRKTDMTAETKFANNVSDLSNSSGVDAGFQFEFYCQRCNDRWRTEFKPYRSG
jgi:hypothetical protein